VGSLLGPVVGAATFTILDEWLVSFNQYRLIVYGVAMLVLFLGFRRGLVPAVQSLVEGGRAGRACGASRAQ
jgi:branched-chain amino acid transport system permease protein